MFKDYEDLIKQMEFEMRRASAEAMRCMLELPENAQEFWLPRADVYETETDLVVRVEAAGVSRESLNVSMSADRRILTIRGTRMERCVDDGKKIRYYQLEVYFGTFERDISLPRDVPVDSSGITATYRDGFLIVTMPKVPEQEISRTIPIEGED